MRTPAKLLIIAWLSMATFSANAEEASPFAGTWCGKWDNLYKVCFEVPADLSTPVTYHWEERLKAPMRSNSLVAEQRNANTLVLDNKVLIFDLKSKQTALAIGMFDAMSRVTPLTKQAPKTAD